MDDVHRVGAYHRGFSSGLGDRGAKRSVGTVWKRALKHRKKLVIAMRNWKMLLLVCFVVTPAHGENFSVATFNAEFLFASKVHVKYGLEFDMKDNPKELQDDWATDGVRLERFSQAVDAVAQFIATINTDVLVLTEVGDDEDFDTLIHSIGRHGTNYRYFKVCECTDNTTGQHVAILSKRPFVETETLLSLPGRAAYDAEIDDPDEQLDTGVSKGMRVAVPVENDQGQIERVYIFGVHLASERGGFDSDQQRIAQATIVRRHAIEVLNRDEHVIIAGDLNDRRGQPTLRRLRGFDDICPDMIQSGHWRYFDREKEATRWTYEFRGERNQIDHILLSYSLRKSQDGTITTSVMEVPQEENPTISDHRPLIVSLQIP